MKGTVLLGDYTLDITEVLLCDGKFQLRCAHRGPVEHAGILQDGDMVRILGEDARSVATFRLHSTGARWSIRPGDDLSMTLPIRIDRISGKAEWADGSQAMV